MNRSLARGMALAVLLAAVLGIAIGPASAAPANAPYATAVDGNNAFAYDLFARLRVPDGGVTNLFFSPYSVSSALAMTRIGAKGATGDEMSAVLHLPNDVPAIDAGYDALNAILNRDPQHAGFSLDVANSLWGQLGEPFLPEYLDAVRKDFGGDLTAVDFTHADAVRQQVNLWVGEKTHGKITDLLAPGTVSPECRLILANAIYFKAAWLTKFDAKSTAKADFHTQHGQTVQADMMHLEHRFPYAEDDRCQALELPYNGGGLAMLVLLPKPTAPGADAKGKADPVEDGMLRLQSSLTPAYVAGLQSQLVGRTVTLSLPKWETTQSVALGDVLQTMGMRHAFTNADFSGINGKSDLSLSQVFHKAWVKVDEDGTEAAGATAIVMLGGALPAPQRPVKFDADHSFVYFIMHPSTGAILFAGRECDPSQGN